MNYVVLINLINKQTRTDQRPRFQMVIAVRDTYESACQHLDEAIHRFYPKAVKVAANQWAADAQSNSGDIVAGVVTPVYTDAPEQDQLIASIRELGWS